MGYAWQLTRSVFFIAQMYLSMALMALFFLPFALFSRRGALFAVHTYCRWVRFTARVLVDLRSEIRGMPPSEPCLIAAKHQSFFDIIMIVSAVPRPRFIMKSELRWAPILGWYALRIDCVPVNRGKRAEAIKQMMDGAKSGEVAPGQLIIYPQGTRVAPGAEKPYKIGTGVLYEQLGQPCHPAACNVGVFWPKRSLLRKPGLAVVEFLPPIPPGRKVEAFMADLEEAIETASNRLMAEAGFR
jgi:1-acyl-sn-glycerol-3-phosphate acyltransferase